MCSGKCKIEWCLRKLNISLFVLSSVGVFTFGVFTAKGVFILCWCIYILPGRFYFLLVYLLHCGRFFYYSVGIFLLLWAYVPHCGR
jgi:hypothetical protein